jgi:hypothetical protein
MKAAQNWTILLFCMSSGDEISNKLKVIVSAELKIYCE